MKIKLPSYVIFTDLDGTLLDHESYSWSPAKEALREIRRNNIPLILNTSKTMAEVLEIQRDLGLGYPFIFENGGAIFYPDSCLEIKPFQGKKLEFLGPEYSTIISILNIIRSDYGFSFQGFSDFSEMDISHHTGLSLNRSNLAKQRLTSEPIKWWDTLDELEVFKTVLKQYHLQLLNGGRFYHVMGNVDKAFAMKYLMEKYLKQYPNMESIALGDGDNDFKMLCEADYSVVIKRFHGETLYLNNKPKTRYSTHPGPSGWNEEMNYFLKHNL